MHNMTITRAGAPVFQGQTSTARMRRTPQEPAAYLFRELTFDAGAFLLTGTGIVPPDGFHPALRRHRQHYDRWHRDVGESSCLAIAGNDGNHRPFTPPPQLD